MVSARTMDMAVVAFLIGRGTYLANLNVEVQRHAGERMIAIDGHFVANDLGNHDGLLAKFTLCVELHSLFELFAAFDLIGRDNGDILRIMKAIGLLGSDADFEGVASLFAFHRLFQAGDDLPFALDIGQRFAANGGVDDVLVVIGEGVVENNNGAGGDLHKRNGCVVRRIPRSHGRELACECQRKARGVWNCLCAGQRAFSIGPILVRVEDEKEERKENQP